MATLTFQDFASTISRGSGKPAAFIGCMALVAAWAVAGPFLSYSNGWLLAINTISSIVTLLMVFLIQNSQIREGIAIQAKLNEIIRAVEAAENRFIGIERLTQNELVQIETEFKEVAEAEAAIVVANAELTASGGTAAS
jgi:low affinity Fe/Cu permease